MGVNEGNTDEGTIVGSLGEGRIEGQLESG